MKTKKTELDVDYIGGQGSMTIAEEKALSDFLKKSKLKSKKSVGNLRLKSVKRRKIKV
jgi:hypothetical protein